MRGGLIGVLFGTTAAVALAEAEETRQLGAHEHGVSTLNVAIEGERVMMELEAPGMDIVGFEHAATSDEDQAAIERAKDTLSDPSRLFVLPAAAGCTVETVEVALADDHDEHDDGEHGEEAHADEEHGEEEHAGEAHDDEEHAGEGGARHTEFQAEYLLGCNDPAALETIRFAFFDEFEGAEEIEVNLVTETGQTSYEVTRDRPEIDLGGVI